MGTEQTLYRWVTHGRNTCAVCFGLEGREMPLAEWRSRVLPGIHAGCDCSLEPVDDLHGESRGVGPALKMGTPLQSARHLGMDHHLSYAHGALKPWARPIKAQRPEIRSRPRLER